MKAGINQLKQDGYSEIRLSAFAENPAIKLYEQLKLTRLVGTY